MITEREIRSITRVDNWMRRIIIIGGIGCLGLFVFLFGFLILQVLPLVQPIALGTTVLLTERWDPTDVRALHVDQNPDEALIITERDVWSVRSDGVVAPLWKSGGGEITASAYWSSSDLLWIGTSSGEVWELLIFRTDETDVVEESIIHEGDGRVLAIDAAVFGERKRVVLVEADNATESAAIIHVLDSSSNSAASRSVTEIADLDQPVERIDLSSDLRGLALQFSDQTHHLWLIDQDEARRLDTADFSGVGDRSSGFGFDAGSRILVLGSSVAGRVGGLLLAEDSARDWAWHAVHFDESSEYGEWRWRSSQFSASSLLFSGEVCHVVNLSLDQRLASFHAPEPIISAELTGKDGGVWTLHASGLAFTPFERAFLDFSFGALVSQPRGDGTAADQWQPSSGLREIQGHYSLVPIFVGTLKGAFLALVLASPIALFAAIYTSQIARSEFVRRIKPLIELIGAVPSVVLGVICAFWISPKVEGYLAEVILFIVYVVTTLLCVMLLRPRLMRWLPSNPGRRGELLWMVGIAALIVLATLLTAPIIEHAFLGFFALPEGASLVDWLELVLGIPYEQRNSLSVAIVLGITTIPFMFSLMDDALRHVPAEQVRASLSLGASRIQTAVNIVLPAAAPGLLAALLISAGRCIGETMIFVMASGNMPTTGMSLFEGFRTVSATLVIELSESSQQSTLYRVLFVAALGLLCVTFIMNTAAALLRENYLRREIWKGAVRGK
ncbi:MAG: ABC transporter permease subunit [Opitutales bacterium]|nr:ABC transporter permease subunit [Opitutales bacterium]NRA26599.1 ABC transporter permease subunit [Opitutales bacterium]